MNKCRINYSIAADGGEDVEVTGVEEVEGDPVERALPFVDAVADFVLPLFRRRQRSHHRLAPQPGTATGDGPIFCH